MNISASQDNSQAALPFQVGAAPPRRLSLRLVVEGEMAGVAACELLSRQSGLAKARIKDAMAKGAVWLGRGKGKKRLRRATTVLKAGEVLELHYDEELLARKPPPPRCLYDAGRYSVWLKPAGLLAQGTECGDHCSLLRLVEQHFQAKRPVLPVHRLDREATGLMLVAHDRKAAAALSALLQAGKIDKRYRITVQGSLEPAEGRIELLLDGKPAITRYTLLSFDPASCCSHVEVALETGRLHQIRRHFAMIGHAVLGDPRYGVGNKNSTGLALIAVSLAFICPLTGKPVRVSLDDP